MNRRTLFAVAVAAVTAFAAPFAPPAFAGDEYRGDRREHRDRDGRRDDDRGAYHRDHDRHRGATFVVYFHVDGGRGRHKAKDRFRAAEIVDLLCGIGVDAHVDDRREVHYRFRGEGRAFFRSHGDAHLLAKRLEEYGFHARVVHR